jgi:hypothetical protein
MTSSSSNILHNSLNKIPSDPPPVSTNMVIIGSPESSIQKVISSNDSFDDFETVENKKKNKRKRKLATPTQSKTNVVAPPVNPVQRDDIIQQITITNESTRYAQSRYPFPPFIIRFNAGKVTPNHVKEGLIAHCKNEYQMEIYILNCRLSNSRSSTENDILLFLKDVSSFSFLLDQNHWPDVFNKVTYVFPSVPSIPPQLSLLIKNVGLHLDFEEFCTEVKTRYPAVKNVIRMKNKFQNNIKLVKLELTSSIARDELLNNKKIIIGYIAYDLDEYLAPANVLICSKCMGLGHFKKQCTQIKDTCRTCGELVDDVKLHNCSKITKCIHCGLDHVSNSLKCQVVKSFRSELTRKLLSSNNLSSSSTSNVLHSMNNTNFNYIGTNFPSLPVSQFLPTNPMISKLDDLLVKMSEVNVHLSNLELKYDKVEKFMLEKNESDLLIKENLNLLSKQSIELKKEVVHHSLIVERHENMFSKLIIPMFVDLFSLIAMQNQDRKGNPLDADLKVKLERYLIQMKKAKDGKHFTN